MPAGSWEPAQSEVVAAAQRHGSDSTKSSYKEVLMTTAHKYSWSESVVLSLAATLIWIITGAAIAAAQSPGLARVPKAPGQGTPQAGAKKAPELPPVLTGISPNSAPPGGIGELVLTGKNFSEGMHLRINGVDTVVLKVESPERAVATIRVADDAPEGEANLEFNWRKMEEWEMSRSRVGTPEAAQVAKSVRFTISNSAPMAVLLGEYILFPEEEINSRKSEEASGNKMNEMREKYKRGEISQEEFMTYMMKAGQSMMAQMQMGTGAQAGQLVPKSMEWQKQEKKGELRLYKGSISFLEGKNTLFTEPVSALKEIAAVPPPAHERTSHELQLAFNDGKKNFLRSEKPAEEEVSRLKKRLGK
jgi:hypothetical protein